LLLHPITVFAVDSNPCSNTTNTKELANCCVTQSKGTWLNVPIFGASYENRCLANPAEYVQKGYNMALGLVGILAVIMIIIGGFQYLTSIGNSSRMSDAKDRITQAILGLVLALLSYLILYVLNPDLVSLKWDTSLLKQEISDASKNIESQIMEGKCNAVGTSIIVNQKTISIVVNQYPLAAWLKVNAVENKVEVLTQKPTQNSNDPNIQYYKVYRDAKNYTCLYSTYDAASNINCGVFGSTCQQAVCVGEVCKIDDKGTKGTCQYKIELNVNQETLGCYPASAP